MFSANKLKYFIYEKINVKNALVAAIVTFSCLTHIQAQHQKWELGLFLEAAQGHTDVQSFDTKNKISP